jgi:hypothetical protein
MKTRRDQGFGEQIMTGTGAQILADHRSRRLKHHHRDGIHRATAVGNQRAVLGDAGHRHRPTSKDGVVQIRQLARHVMLCGQPR